MTQHTEKQVRQTAAETTAETAAETAAEVAWDAELADREERRHTPMACALRDVIEEAGGATDQQSLARDFLAAANRIMERLRRES